MAPHGSQSWQSRIWADSQVIKCYFTTQPRNHRRPERRFHGWMIPEGETGHSQNLAVPFRILYRSERYHGKTTGHKKAQSINMATGLYESPDLKRLTFIFSESTPTQ